MCYFCSLQCKSDLPGFTYYTVLNINTNSITGYWLLIGKKSIQIKACAFSEKEERPGNVGYPVYCEVLFCIEFICRLENAMLFTYLMQLLTPGLRNPAAQMLPDQSCCHSKPLLAELKYSTWQLTRLKWVTSKKQKQKKNPTGLCFRHGL